MIGSDSEGSSLGWHTGPDNPMVGPDGKLRDIHGRPQQFVYSPSETAALNHHLQANAEDDLPSALQSDINSARTKYIIKHVVRTNPLEILEKEMLAAKNRVAASSTSKRVVDA